MKVRKPDTAFTVKLEPWDVERLVRAAAQIQNVYAYIRGDREAPYVGDALIMLSDLARELSE